MPLTVRPATEEDYQAIARSDDLFLEGEEPASAQELMGRGAVFPEGILCAFTDSGELAGYLESWIWDVPTSAVFYEPHYTPDIHIPSGRFLYIYLVATGKSHRKKGVGSALIDAAKKLAMSMNLSGVQLGAVKNLADGFYAHIGFKRSHTAPEFYDGQSHEIMYWSNT